MKKDLTALNNELNIISLEYDDLYNRYPNFLPDGAHNNVPPDIEQRKNWLSKRIDNLRININQAKMKNMNK